MSSHAYIELSTPGGSFEYLYLADLFDGKMPRLVEHMASAIRDLVPDSEAEHDTRTVIEFFDTLSKLQAHLADVWHDVEWARSGDETTTRAKRTILTYKGFGDRKRLVEAAPDGPKCGRCHRGAAMLVATGAEDEWLCDSCGVRLITNRFAKDGDIAQIEMQKIDGNRVILTRDEWSHAVESSWRNCQKLITG